MSALYGFLTMTTPRPPKNLIWLFLHESFCVTFGCLTCCLLLGSFCVWHVVVHYNVRALLKEKTPQLPMRTTLVTFNIITISHKLSTSELWCDFCKRVDPSPGPLRFKSQINFSCIAIKYFSLIHFYCKAKSAINYLNSPWWLASTKYQVSATQPSTKYQVPKFSMMALLLDSPIVKHWSCIHSSGALHQIPDIKIIWK